jgi:hydroxymethylpyrimidine kinase/phosphomethylpyrimidine kinase/thiamine-phosphate diphosphorylase
VRPRDERLRLLAEARVYAIAPAAIRAGALADWIPRLCAAGAGIVQLRDRDLPPAALRAAARACAEAARSYGALLIVNDDPLLAAEVGADGVHLGQDDGAIDWARGIVGPDAIVGRTTRGGAVLAAAQAEGADYASVSPLWATPTKPGRVPAGLGAAIAAARTATIPWFALGGLDPVRARRVAAVGATRVAAVREITEAPDPAAAVRGLVACLDTNPRVLAVAGSDSGGGAGLQADIKAISAAGGFPLTSVTALTAQSTIGVEAVHPVPPDFVAHQMRIVIGDLGVDAVKTGMLADAAVIEAVAGELGALDPTLLVPVVVDPVLRAESGASLLAADALRTLRERLAPLATVLTPNLFEAQALAEVEDDDAAELARRVHDRTGTAVVVTGGHGPSSADVLCAEGQLHVIDGPRLDVPHTHGAGCTYASTLATLLGGGMALPEAAQEAKRAATAAVRAGRSYGAGAGPVDVIRAVRG